MIYIIRTLLVFSIGASSALTQALTIAPNGPEQAPLVFVHGFIDDGTGWARQSLFQAEEMFSPLLMKYLRHYHFGPQRSPSALFTEQGVDNYAVQWWSRDGGNPYASADDGFAFLQTADELLAGTDWVKGTWMAQNRPIPSAIDVLTASEIDVAVNFLPISKTIFGVGASLAAKVALASQLWIENNYQDAGLIDPRAQDFLQMLREERRPGGRFEHSRQVNIITHSMGSLVTRAMLDKAADASRQDSEFVANVIYNAPPFAGSTMAYLAKIYFEPAVITSDIFADERFALMLSTSASTYKDLMVNFLDLFMRPIGLEYADIEHNMPLAIRNVIDFLILYPIDSVVDATFIQNMVGTNRGELLAAAMQTVRPLVRGLTGAGGAPGYNDLTPEGGVNHLNLYQTNADVKQFVTLGTQGYGIHLFPDDLDAVASDPTLITNNAVLTAQSDDTAVAVGSAKLLTETDAFGPCMQLLGEFDLEHPDLLYRRPEVMAPVWFQTFLVPPTSLSITGDMVAISSERRSYYSSGGEVSIRFSSTIENRDIRFSVIPFIPTPADQTVRIRAVAYEYRIVSDDSTEVLVDWQITEPLEQLDLMALVDREHLEDRPFRFEWRGVNVYGGKELIRDARFIVAGDAPQVIDYYVVGNSTEVYEMPRSALSGAVGVRSNTLSELSINTGATVLAAVVSQPEAGWVVSRPASKALTMTFDQTATLAYQFDNPSLAQPITKTQVNGALIELGDLSEGPHALYFRLSKEVAGNIIQSQIQRVTLQVDNTAPILAIDLVENHPLGVVVGPQTPLSFSVQDIGVNGGTGTLRVSGQPDWQFRSGQVFTLNQTGLVEQMRSANIAGAETTLALSARDAVNNIANDIQTVYVDVAPPDIVIESLTPVSPVSELHYVTFAQSVDLVVDVNDQGAGLDADLPRLAISNANGEVQLVGPLFLGDIPGFPEHHGIHVPLSLGENYLAVSVRDLADNIGTLTLVIERREALSDGFDIDSVTPRLNRTDCYGVNGDVKTCPIGSINSFDVSYNGETVAFASGGERFVEGDNNGKDDVFVWQRGKLSLISSNEDGTQANASSFRPAISGNGRYVVFETKSTNLLANTTGANLYLKDTVTGKLAIISRNPDGAPINVTSNGNFYSSVTYSGRYVFFSSNNATYLSTFPNPGVQVYMVDLDPDNNGDFFDDNYITYPISNVNATDMPSGSSSAPKATQDGRYVVYKSNTDGALKLVRINGSDTDGSLDTTIRSETLLPNATVYDISPFGDNVVFSTTRNLLGADTNTEFLDTDVYLSTGEFVGGNFASRSLHYVSISHNGAATTMDRALPLQDVAIARDAPAGATELKVAWVSSHSNILPNDANGTEDLFVYRTSSVFPSGLPVPNWISSSVLSNGTVYTGALSPDGRYAFFSTQQDYNSPYSGNGTRHLYRRRIDDVSDHVLTVQSSTGGKVLRSPEGTSVGAGEYKYSNEPDLLLIAQADPGYRFVGWDNNPSLTHEQRALSMTENQNVTAVFEEAPRPVSASLNLTTSQNTASEATSPNVTGDSLAYEVRIISQPAHGEVFVQLNKFVYLPDKNTFGEDTFEFDVINEFGMGLAAPAVAQVNVIATNQPPESIVLSIETEKNTASAEVQPTVVDPDDMVFTFQIMQPPTHGVVQQTPSGFIYTPVSEFVGQDSFVVRATDSEDQSVSGVARVDVLEKEITVPPTEDDGKPRKKSGSLGALLGILLLPFLCFRRRPVIFRERM